LYVVRTSSLPCWLLVCSNFTWSWACYWCLNAMLLNLSPSIAWNSQDQWSSIGCWLFAWALFHWFHPMRTFHFVCQCCVVSIKWGGYYTSAIGWLCFDHFAMPFVHIASNYFLHFYNLFLIQFSLKNYEIFCMMITKMSTILWWILIIFPLAGF
jgi:hypothetical protein